MLTVTLCPLQECLCWRRASWRTSELPKWTSANTVASLRIRWLPDAGFTGGATRLPRQTWPRRCVPCRSHLPRRPDGYASCKATRAPLPSPPPDRRAKVASGSCRRGVTRFNSVEPDIPTVSYHVHLHSPTIWRHCWNSVLIFSVGRTVRLS